MAIKAHAVFVLRCIAAQSGFSGARCQIRGLVRHSHRVQSLSIYDRAWSSQGLPP
jgi:hypothetical protein